MFMKQGYRNEGMWFVTILKQATKSDFHKYR